MSTAIDREDNETVCQLQRVSGSLASVSWLLCSKRGCGWCITYKIGSQKEEEEEEELIHNAKHIMTRKI